jgi:hypothetical protein
MKRPVYLICIVLLLSCQKGPEKENLPLLNGYWEIEEAEAPDGTSREYAVSTTIDYLEIEGMQGYRKKLQPRADGGFLASDDASFFEIREDKGRFFMSYHTDFASWEEELLRLDTDGFTVVNADNITYHYRRFKPISTTHGLLQKK